MKIVWIFQKETDFLCNRHNFSGKSAQINGFFVVFKEKQTILFLPQKYSLSAWFVEFPRNLYYNRNIERRWNRWISGS